MSQEEVSSLVEMSMLFFFKRESLSREKFRSLSSNKSRIRENEKRKKRANRIFLRIIGIAQRMIRGVKSTLRARITFQVGIKVQPLYLNFHYTTVRTKIHLWSSITNLMPIRSRTC